MVIWCESGGGPGYHLVQEWTVLLLSLAFATVRKFMVTELQWLTLHGNLFLLGVCTHDVGLYLCSIFCIRNLALRVIALLESGTRPNCIP